MPARTWLGIVVAALVVLWPGSAAAGFRLGATTPAGMPAGPTAAVQTPAEPEPPAFSGGVAAMALAPPPAPPPGGAAKAGADPSGARARGRGRSVNRRSVPPFWIHRESPTHHVRAVAFPPLFVHRTPKRGHPEKLLHADLTLTFGWYDRAQEKRRWMSVTGLFLGSFSERKTVWGAVPLLMGYRRVGEQYNFGQFPLFWAWGTRSVKNFLAIPFHYQQRAPDGFRGVSGVLFWYGNKNLNDADLNNDRKHFVAAPAFYRFERGLRQFDISPVYFGGHNKLKGLDHRTILPFVHWQSREFGNRKELWTALWIRRTDKARKHKVWALPPLLTFRHDTPDRRIFSATPLFWRTRNKLKGSKLTLLGPVGVYDDPRQRIGIGAPIYWQFTDKKAKTTAAVLLPLAIARRSPGRLGVWTLLGGGVRGPKGWGAAIPPALTFVGRRENGVRYQGIAGIFWHVNNPAGADGKGTDHTVLGPLFYRSRKGNDKRLGIPPALVFTRYGGTKRYQVITPLLWHLRDTSAEDGRNLWVAGPYYHVRRTGTAGVGPGSYGGLPPVVFYGRGEKYRYGIVPPLLFAHVTDVKAKSRLTISPVFVRSKKPGHRTLGILALGWDVKRPDERHSVVFPLFYRRQMGKKVLSITPIGGRYARDGKATWVYALAFGHRHATRRSYGFLPVFFHDVHKKDGGKRVHTGFIPLYLRRRTPTDDLDMWTPLVWRRDLRGDKARKGLAVVPFYFRQRQPEGVDVDAGLGFFYSRNKVRRTHTLIAGPGFHRLSREGLNAGIAPLWWWMDSPKKRRLLALPAIFHFKDKGGPSHTTVAIPLWFDRLRANGRRTWAAFPFVFGGRRLNNFTRFSLAPPGYVDVFRLGRNTRFTGFVPLLFRYQKCGFRKEDSAKCRYTLWGSFPLFLYGKDGNGRKTHAAALLYYYDKRPDGFRLYTPLAGVNYRPGKTLGVYAWPVAVKTTQTFRRVLVFPLYYRKATRPELRGSTTVKQRALTLVVPPLYIGRTRGDRRFFEAGLLVWQSRQQHKVSTAVAPPIFYHSHAYAQRRLTWLLPIFLRDNQMAKDQAWTAIGPFAYVQRRRGKDLDFVQFPLVWHFERGENQGTWGAAVWWDIRVKGTTVQFVPGAFTRWKHSDNAVNMVGPGLAWWTKGQGDAAGDRGWRILFGAFGAGVEDGKRYTAVFGRKIPMRSKAAKAAARRDRQQRRAAKAQVRRDRAALRTQARAQARRDRKAARTQARAQTRAQTKAHTRRDRRTARAQAAAQARAKRRARRVSSSAAG